MATKVLLDSGASTTFISDAFVRKHNVTLTPLCNPILLHNADGSSNVIGQIMHEAHLSMMVGTHYESIAACVANIGEDDVILGVDWL